MSSEYKDHDGEQEEAIMNAKIYKFPLSSSLCENTFI